MNKENRTTLLAFATCLLALIITAVIMKDRMHNYSSYEYYQVHILNTEYKEKMAEYHVENPVTDANWEETAHSIGIPADSLSIGMYLLHLKE